MIDPHAPTTVETPRLRLRPPRPDDTAFHHALHSDAATYTHAPWAVSDDPVRHRVAFHAWQEHWGREGFGYWIVEERTSGRAVGAAGVTALAGDELNLYYRFSSGSHGQGYGREAARGVLSWATEWLPERQVVAVVRPENVASERTARSAGLSLTGTHVVEEDPAEAGPSNVWRAPRVRREDPSDALREELLDVWCAVNAAGGAVGFLVDSPRSEVAAVLDAQLARTGDDVPLLTLRDPAGGAVLGFCWWIRDPFVLFEHSVVLKRFMVDPAAQGRNLGSVLLGGALAHARTMPDVDLLRLDYRSGYGLGTFYARHGFVEVGRVPRLVRLAGGDQRDLVAMARHPFGAPLDADGRL